MRNVNKDYLAKVASLSEEKIDELFNHFRLELGRFFEEQKLSREEAIAIQLEVEDEQLQDWRKHRVEMNEIFTYS